MKTPQQSYPNLAEALNVSEIYLKREDEHKYGSHKGRSIPLMIKHYHENGWLDFVISSSGNAALAAILAIESHNRNKPDDPLTFKIFVGKNIDQIKLNRLRIQITDHRSQINIEQVDRPKQNAFQLDKEGKAKNLRQSTDDIALIGYHELAAELDKIPELQAIFIPTSSGTTAQGLGEAFGRLKNKPQIHIVQTETCHPIAAALNVIPAKAGIQKHDNDWMPDQVGHDINDTTKQSIASAIVDKVAHRKNKVVEIIKKSGGSGWIVSDEEIKNARELVKQTAGVKISSNSALSVAGLKKAVENGWKFKAPVVCLITGA